jgi:hypothetical protein
LFMGAKRRFARWVFERQIVPFAVEFLVLRRLETRLAPMTVRAIMRCRRETKPGGIHQRERCRAQFAAICGAMVAIAKMGVLRGRRHTSNGLDYLRSHVPGYVEATNYVDEPAVRDRGLITASGLGDVEFARELFEELDVLSADDRALWGQIFRSARLPGGSA